MNDELDYCHNGEKILVKRWIDSKGYGQRIQFNYKGLFIDEYKKDANMNYYMDITDFMCDIIDIIGKEKFNKFYDYYDKYKSLNKRYIILDNKVYKSNKEKYLLEKKTYEYKEILRWFTENGILDYVSKFVKK